METITVADSVQSAGMNSYLEMPVRRGVKMTVENLSVEDAAFYYQVGYILSDVPEDAAYLHASWR